MGPSFDSTVETLVVVKSDGKATYIPQAILNIPCVMNFTNYPFDEQTCVLKLGSWSHDGGKVTRKI